MVGPTCCSACRSHHDCDRPVLGVRSPTAHLRGAAQVRDAAYREAHIRSVRAKRPYAKACASNALRTPDPDLDTGAAGAAARQDLRPGGSPCGTEGSKEPGG